MTEPATRPEESTWPALIDDAMQVVYRVAIQSPLDVMPRLSAGTGHEVLLKREDRQVVFSFKLRGAINKIATLSAAQRQRGVICSSAGNHAQGVALAARLYDCHAVIVMPITTPEIKIDAVRALDAEVVLEGDNYDAAQAHAHTLAEQRELTFVHPFDDPAVIAGQATIGRELLEQCAEAPDAVFIPVGGGGLAAGIALALRAQWPNTRLIGVEPEESASMRAAIEAGGPVTLDSVGIFADGVAVRRVGDLTHALCAELLDEIVTVTTDATCAAIRDIYEDTRSVVEPAGALAVAAAKQWCNSRGTDATRVVALCCGANLNFDRLRHIAERAAVGEHREALYAVRIAEEPGSFLKFCQHLGNVGVTEFNYRHNSERFARIFVGIALGGGEKERHELLTRITDAGFDADDLSDNELAKLHVRHLVGGRSEHAEERLYRCEFPERPGALGAFLQALGSDWDITLFHYRNHGSDYGRVLVGLRPTRDSVERLEVRLESVGYRFTEETDNPAYRLFLT